ncbi:hypothetical protein SCHPADRAFT_202449 [Schizopora paradoxa]|uniref:Uncharacterized protein n=1 Tax=Schizopora paradoxa TaxID=27342 RepID=A0A0H2RYF4_9AGAM|nr:hypothetical protein SCHPADRAFT_202449 [Schizopora paradoxa]
MNKRNSFRYRRSKPHIMRLRVVSLYFLTFNIQLIVFSALPNLPSTGSRLLTGAHWKMALFIIGAICAMAFNHAFYKYVDGKAPNSSLRNSGSSKLLLNQTVVSEIGIALAYAGQTLLAVAIATACHQMFWRAIRDRGNTISGIDSVMTVQNSPFTLSIFSALRVSVIVPFLALLAASTPLVSIFAPGSIKVATDFNQVGNCTVFAPRDLSSLAVNISFKGKGAGNNIPLQTVLASGSYIPPIDVCGSSLSASRSQCNYDLQFTGPGFDCGEATTSNDYSSFVSPSVSGSGAMLLQANLIPQTTDDLSLQVFVQTWDVKRSVYQGTNCTGVVRSYSVNVQSSEGNVPVLDVTDSSIVSTIQANASQLDSFSENYVYDHMTLLSNLMAYITGGSPQYSSILSTTPGGIGSIQADGNITWNANLSQALEGFSRNATLSVLSGQVLTFNPDVPNILENDTTSCTYTSTAYEYTPKRLFLAYGVGIFVALLCVICGAVAIWRNGVEETMDFSRILRAILNDRMFNAVDNLDKDTVVKADETAEGALAPLRHRF